MPRTRAPRRLDANQIAGVAVAMTAATDEEFAAGIPLTDPGAILVGDRPRTNFQVRAAKKRVKKSASPTAQTKKEKALAQFRASRGGLTKPIPAKKKVVKKSVRSHG